MYQITVSPDTFNVLPTLVGQNPFIDASHKVNKSKAFKEHANLRKALSKNVHFSVKTDESLPDLVFIANGGFSLPRLPEPVIILPNMKYPSRKAELPYDREIFQRLGIKVYEYEGKAPFEGGAEVAWFHDYTLMVHGYGYRSSKESVKELQTLVTSIYKHYKIQPPHFTALQLQSPRFYHLDLAMFAYNNGCIVQKGAFDAKTLEKLRKAIGSVTVVDTKDPYALNAIQEEKKIITHVQQDKHVKECIETLSKKKVVEVDLREFEKGGGAAGCLHITVFDPRV